MMTPYSHSRQRPARRAFVMSSVPSGTTTPIPHGVAHAQLTVPALVELALKRGEGTLTDRGALATLTGKHTGRAPKDRYLVVTPEQSSLIDWGPINRAMDTATFDRLFSRA